MSGSACTTELRRVDVSRSRTVDSAVSRDDVGRAFQVLVASLWRKLDGICQQEFGDHKHPKGRKPFPLWKLSGRPRIYGSGGLSVEEARRRLATRVWRPQAPERKKTLLLLETLWLAQDLWVSTTDPSIVVLQLPMIIKGLFRRYQRWNPVHPTVGAFWGMGVGLGCGVGWGPGFGPEVIGYVGAGCGVGFCVGITLAGVGIGLPANALIEIPYNAFTVTSSSAVNALDFARSIAFPAAKSMAGESWNYVVPRVTLLSKEACDGLSSFKVNSSLRKGVEFSELRKAISHHTQSALECFGELRNKRSSPGRGLD